MIIMDLGKILRSKTNVIFVHEKADFKMIHKMRINIVLKLTSHSTLLNCWHHTPRYCENLHDIRPVHCPVQFRFHQQEQVRPKQYFCLCWVDIEIFHCDYKFVFSFFFMSQTIRQSIQDHVSLLTQATLFIIQLLIKWKKEFLWSKFL